MDFLTAAVTGFFLLGISQLVCSWGLTKSHIIGWGWASIMFNGRGAKKNVLLKKAVVLHKRSRIQGLEVFV